MAEAISMNKVIAEKDYKGFTGKTTFYLMADGTYSIGLIDGEIKCKDFKSFLAMGTKLTKDQTKANKGEGYSHFQFEPFINEDQEMGGKDYIYEITYGREVVQAEILRYKESEKNKKDAELEQLNRLQMKYPKK